MRRWPSSVSIRSVALRLCPRCFFGVGVAIRILSANIYYRCEKCQYRWTVIKPKDVSDD